MAHFAELNSDNIVTRVVVIDNNNCLDDNGNESETVGISFCRSLYGNDTNWVQTSYNSSFRGNYACLLYTSPSPRDVEESRMPSSA